MKKIFSTAAVVAASAFMLNAVAFGACPIKPNNTACTIGTPTGAAAPVSYSYIVQPVAKRTYLPACNNCAQQPVKKNFFQRAMTPVTGVYDAMIGPFFNLYN